MTTENTLSNQLKKHLLGGEAFLPVDEILKKIPFDRLGERPAGLPYSFYELFYHIQFTQRDILEYCRNKDYAAPEWPKDYWSGEKAPTDNASWNELQNSFFEDRRQLMELIGTEDHRLSDPVPSKNEHTIFREMLLVIEHTAYHTGQLVIILRQLNLLPE